MCKSSNRVVLTFNAGLADFNFCELVTHTRTSVVAGAEGSIAVWYRYHAEWSRPVCCIHCMSLGTDGHMGEGVCKALGV